MNPLDYFEDWFRRAKHGDRYVYYFGSLAADRRKTFLISGDFVNVVHPVDPVATRAYGLAKGGKLHLIQKKVADDKYEYIAQRIRRRERFGFSGLPLFRGRRGAWRQNTFMK